MKGIAEEIKKEIKTKKGELEVLLKTVEEWLIETKLEEQDLMVLAQDARRINIPSNYTKLFLERVDAALSAVRSERDKFQKEVDGLKIDIEHLNMFNI